MSKKVFLIYVGKRPRQWSELETEWITRLNLIDLKLLEVKPKFEQDACGKEILKKIGDITKNNFNSSSAKCSVYLMDERGKSFTSEKFATQLRNDFDQLKVSIFIIGGPYGLASELKEYPGVNLISLSQMTLPHQMARMFLIEQIYRAETIIQGHPYHH